MAKVQKVEDLIAWQKAEALAELVYSACRSGELARDFGLRDQMQRAAVSVMSNIAEGFERKTTTDFSHFLYIAKGSLGELKSQLFLAARLKLIPLPFSVPLTLWQMKQGKSSLASSLLLPKSRKT